MGKSIKILVPKLKDTTGSIEVQKQAWLATYPNKKYCVTADDVEERYKNAFTGRRLESRKKLITHPGKNEKFLVAKDDDKVIGIVYGFRYKNKNQLHAIYVSPKYFRKGVGTKLWNALKKFFNPNKDTYVELVAYNTQALNFYKKLGFVDTGRRFQDERFRMKSGAIMPEMEMVLRHK